MTVTTGEISNRRDFFRKLGYYATGIAIGFALLGVFQRLRTIEHQRREQAAREAATRRSEGVPPPPPDLPQDTSAASTGK